MILLIRDTERWSFYIDCVHPHPRHSSRRDVRIKESPPHSNKRPNTFQLVRELITSYSMGTRRFYFTYDRTGFVPKPRKRNLVKVPLSFTFILRGRETQKEGRDGEDLPIRGSIISPTKTNHLYVFWKF